MKPSRTKEFITIIGMGLGFLALPLYAWSVFFFGSRGCGAISILIIWVDNILGWLGVFVVYGGYGALMGWMGYRDVTSNKKLSNRTVKLTIVALLVGAFFFLIPICG